jgi:hypothetical protein
MGGPAVSLIKTLRHTNYFRISNIPQRDAIDLLGSSKGSNNVTCSPKLTRAEF